MRRELANNGRVMRQKGDAMEYVFNDWHFVEHFKRSGKVYGCLWRGEKPQEFGFWNLVQFEMDVFAQFSRV